MDAPSAPRESQVRTRRRLTESPIIGPRANTAAAGGFMAVLAPPASAGAGAAQARLRWPASLGLGKKGRGTPSPALALGVESSERGGLHETVGWSAVGRSRRVGGGLTGCPQSGTVTAVLRFVRSAHPAAGHARGRPRRRDR